MATSVVLLRGVNVGRHRRVTMADLRASLARAGYHDVETYVQSGNLLVGTRVGAARLTADVESALHTDLGLDIDAIVRTGTQLRNVLATNPFLAEAVPTAALHVGYAKTKPARAAVASLAARDFGRDRATVVGADVYLCYPDGQGRSKMTGAMLEKVLGVPITVRNWNVTTALAQRAGGAKPAS
jgi:uncharacterized protein (DUF1697 family)